MKVLVTGGAGFIGSHICERLLSMGHSVVCVDNFSAGRKSNIEHFLSLPNFQLYTCDICYLTADVFKDVDLVCHQAALGSVPRSMKFPTDFNRVNVNGFMHVLQLALEANVKRVVYASSSSVYGDNLTMPKQENEIGRPLSPYAATKQINELYADVYNRCYGMETIGLRYFNVFGPRQNQFGDYAAVIPSFISRLAAGLRCTINGDGSIMRDFTYVSNVVDANIAALFSTNPDIVGVYNIGCGELTSIKRLYEMLRDITHSDDNVIFGPARAGDIVLSVADISKATKTFNYTPTIGVEDGLKTTVQLYMETFR